MDVCFSAVVVYPTGAKSLTFDEVDMKEGFDVQNRQVDAFFYNEDGDICREPPLSARCCRLGRSLFILGGVILNRGDPAHPKNLWSLETPKPGGGGLLPAWSTSVSLNRKNVCMAMTVPYEDRLFVFQCGRGGGWIDVYFTKSRELLAPPRKLPPYLAVMDYPCSYFLWEKEGREKPLIVLDFGFMDYEKPHLLMSYDAEQDRWETMDSNFPTTAVDCHIRLLAPFDRNTLLIIDEPALWSVYDMRSKAVTAVPVCLSDLQLKCECEIGVLKFGFYRRCPDTDSLIIYMFLQTSVLGPADQTEVPYTKVKFQYHESRGPVATVEYAGTLNTGRHYEDVYIFDGETNTRNEPSVHEKNRNPKRRRTH